MKTNVPKHLHIKHCRSCYSHLAGEVGVQITEALETKGFITKAEGGGYTVSDAGWKWFGQLGINRNEIMKKRQPTARQCLDFTEHRPHLAGALGTALLSNMMEKCWLARPDETRALILTEKGRIELKSLLGLKF